MENCGACRGPQSPTEIERHNCYHKRLLATKYQSRALICEIGFSSKDPVLSLQLIDSVILGGAGRREGGLRSRRDPETFGICSAGSDFFSPHAHASMQGFFMHD